jgi:hypothetical protein
VAQEVHRISLARSRRGPVQATAERAGIRHTVTRSWSCLATLYP